MFQPVHVFLLRFLGTGQVSQLAGQNPEEPLPSVPNHPPLVIPSSYPAEEPPAEHYDPWARSIEWWRAGLCMLMRLKYLDGRDAGRAFMDKYVKVAPGQPQPEGGLLGAHDMCKDIHETLTRHGIQNILGTRTFSLPDLYFGMVTKDTTYPPPPRRYLECHTLPNAFISDSMLGLMNFQDPKKHEFVSIHYLLHRCG